MASSFLHPFTSPRKEEFISISGGKGAVVIDTNGNEYIDGMASLWYANVGYGREEIAEVVAKTMKQLLFCSILLRLKHHQ